MKGESLMHNTFKYLVFIATCGLLAGYTFFTEYGKR